MYVTSRGQDKVKYPSMLSELESTTISHQFMSFTLIVTSPGTSYFLTIYNDIDIWFESG